MKFAGARMLDQVNMERIHPIGHRACIEMSMQSAKYHRHSPFREPHGEESPNLAQFPGNVI